MMKVQQTGSIQPTAKKPQAAPTQELGAKGAKAGGYGTDAFTKSTYTLASAGEAPVDRRKGLEEAFGRVRDLAGAAPDAHLSPAEAEAVQLRLDQVVAVFGESDVKAMTRAVTALLWRARQGETGPEVAAPAIASKLEGLFGFYEAKMHELRFNKAKAQTLENAIVNTGRKLANVRPAAKPEVEAPLATQPPVATPDPAVTRFAALGHNGHASKAVAAELGGIADALSVSAYAFGARGDALRPAIDALALVALESGRGVGVPPVEVAERARGALAAIEAAKADAPAGERAILARAAAAIAAALDATAARFAPMTSEAFWAEVRADEARKQEERKQEERAREAHARKAPAPEPAAPAERLLLGLPMFRIPGWMSFQAFKPAYDLAATQAAAWGGPYGAAAAATYGALSRIVPEDW